MTHYQYNTSIFVASLFHFIEQHNQMYFGGEGEGDENLTLVQKGPYYFPKIISRSQKSLLSFVGCGRLLGLIDEI